MPSRLILSLFHAAFLIFLTLDGAKAQSSDEGAEITLLLPKSLAWEDGTFSPHDAWRALEPWVNSLEQKSNTEVRTPEQAFKLLGWAAEGEFVNGSYSSNFSFSTNLVGRVTVPTELVKPDANWIAVESALGLDTFGSVRVRLAMVQAMTLGAQLPRSEADLQDFVSMLDPQTREFLTRAICPHCYIIDDPSFIPVVFPDGNSVPSANPVLMLYPSLVNASGGIPTKIGGQPALTATPILDFESRMIAATVFIVGKRAAESRKSEPDGSIIFSGQHTFKKILYGDSRLCPPGLQGYDAMRSYHEIEVLAGCGGVIVKDSDERPWLMTAKHCMSPHTYAKEMLLLSDRVVRGALADMVNRPPRSTDYRVIAPFPKAHPHPSADVVLLELPQDMVEKAIPLPDRDSMRVSEGQSVTALSFPLGLPLTFVQGGDTVVSKVASDRFWARIDNFSKSSGSPVFTDWGALQGILVRQPNPNAENLDIWYDGNCFVPRTEISEKSATAWLGAEVLDARLALEILEGLK